LDIINDLELRFRDRQRVPKYQHIIDAVRHKIRSGELKKGDRVPSINALCKRYQLSQDTVLMAYNELKARGTLTSHVGKGYFVQSDRADTGHRVFLLFDKLTAYKEALYESFKDALAGRGMEQIFFHHDNPEIFHRLLEMARGEYTDYVIMPIEDDSCQRAMEQLPGGRVYLLDQGKTTYGGQYPGVWQDFERDMVGVLQENEDSVCRYSRVILLTGRQGVARRAIAKGFREYCHRSGREPVVALAAPLIEIRQGDLIIAIDDKDLEYLVRFAAENGLEPGRDLGIISYNETPLKGIAGPGITTISTDFASMGKSMAEMIVSGKKKKVDNPFRMYRRASF
jgi:DNA-binding transcriptional regulator YhcF (GntR family)